MTDKIKKQGQLLSKCHGIVALAMKSSCYAVLILGYMSCSSNYSFDRLNCESLTEIDAKVKIFKPCRQFIYEVKFWSDEYDLISTERISLTATGNRWAYDSSQLEVVIQYDNSDTDLGLIRDQNINKAREITMVKSETTGVIERTNYVWMHPIRSNQYHFTEVAPFPQIKLPVIEGEEWESELNIYEGWGGWSNEIIKWKYKILEDKLVDIPFGEFKSTRIESFATTTFGTSTAQMWFHDEYGFVKTIIKNYAGQILSIELAEIIDT